MKWKKRWNGPKVHWYYNVNNPVWQCENKHLLYFSDICFSKFFRQILSYNLNINNNSSADWSVWNLRGKTIKLPDCSFHWTTNRSTPGEARSTLQATLTLRLWMSKMLRFWGVGGGSGIRTFYRYYLEDWHKGSGFWAYANSLPQIVTSMLKWDVPNALEAWQE